MKFAQIPVWAYAEGDKSWYQLAAALVLSGNENKWVKLDAKTQRAILGNPWLGKQSVGIFDGQLMVSRVVCFGTDSDTRYINPSNLNSRYDQWVSP